MSGYDYLFDMTLIWIQPPVIVQIGFRYLYYFFILLVHNSSFAPLFAPLVRYFAPLLIDVWLKWRTLTRVCFPYPFNRFFLKIICVCMCECNYFVSYFRVSGSWTFDHICSCAVWNWAVLMITMKHFKSTCLLPMHRAGCDNFLFIVYLFICNYYWQLWFLAWNAILPSISR